MASPSTLIELRDVTLRYRRAAEPILKGIDLEIRRGEFVGIVAPVASGKSTLLYLMCGVIPHYLEAELQGQVLIFGQETREQSLAQITARVGLVMQDPETQLFNLIVRDEILWGLENRGYSRPEMTRILHETLRFFDINPLRDRITYDLSGGEKQRVALSAVYVTRPEVLLMDHPTSQLDPSGAAQVIENIRRLIDEGVTVVMVEDKVDELLEHADRLLLLREGQIALDALPREFCAAVDILAEAGIRLPQVTDLALRLQRAGLPLPELPVTFEEALTAFRDLLTDHA